MEYIRIGKDFTIRWPILTNSEPEPLEGRDLKLYLNTPSRKQIEVPFAVDEITLMVRIVPSLQIDLGVYSFTLWENFGKDGQTVVDSCKAFCLVDNTSKEKTTPCCCGGSDITSELVKLTIGDMTFSPIVLDGGGGSNIVVDSELSETSTNPVQNKVITTEVNAIKEDVEDNSEGIEGAVKKSEDAHKTATQVANDVKGLTDQVTTLADKVEKVESGEIVWQDVD